MTASPSCSASHTCGADWSRHGRPDQLPRRRLVGGFIVTGRGWGKTRTGAEWIKQQALALPGSKVGGEWRPPTRTPATPASRAPGCSPCSPTTGSTRGTAASVSWCGERVPTVKLFAAEQPDRLQGPQHHGAWCVAAEVPVRTARGDDADR